VSGASGGGCGGLTLAVVVGAVVGVALGVVVGAPGVCPPGSGEALLLQAISSATEAREQKAKKRIPKM